MGWRKKKNIVIFSAFVVISFILYQLYFFFTITSIPTQGNKILEVMDHSSFQKLNYLFIKTSEDNYINNNGVLRGVLLTNMPQYRPDIKDEFKCLKIDQLIPFEHVNDDYCDCEDSSDEPSTSACVDGVFYCDMQSTSKHSTLNVIPSSKVNDGICDCCDGSDEWLHAGNKMLLTQGSVQLRRYYETKCLYIC